MKLSVIVPTLNEEKDLPDCLKSVKSLADETIVVDSGSTDNTVGVARKFGAKVVSHPFKTYSDTRNFGDNQASGEWILSLEADVVVSSDLSAEIQQVVNSDKYDAYKIGRINYIWGAPVMHTDWGPKDDTHIWLYRRRSGKWQSMVHEEFVTNGKVGTLKNYLKHKNYETVSEFIEKIDKYSELSNKQKNFFPDWYFLRDFCKRYFYKLGFLDGYRGLFLSYLQAVYYLTLTVKRYTKS